MDATRREREMWMIEFCIKIVNTQQIVDCDMTFQYIDNKMSLAICIVNNFYSDPKSTRIVSEY